MLKQSGNGLRIVQVKILLIHLFYIGKCLCRMELVRFNFARLCHYLADNISLNRHSYLEGLNKNKDVVDANGQHKERNDLNNNESGRNANVTEETDARSNRQEDHDHTSKTKRHLAIQLQHKNKVLDKKVNLQLLIMFQVYISKVKKLV